VQTNTPDDAALAAVLRLIRLHATLEARFDASLGAVHGLGLNDLVLLLNLDRAEAGVMRRTDLASALALSQSTVTRKAAPLEKLGFVERRSDARDARVGLLALTDAGRERVRDAQATLRRLARDVFADRWSDADLRTLAELLGRLTAALPGNLK
jgi:DNA-binding MarR family transcriptional regulator